MMHAEIEQQDIIGRYIRRELQAAEQQAFEEHFFGCDGCFQHLRDAERYQAGIRAAAARGLLEDAARGTQAARGVRLQWAFAATACATVVLLAIAGWLYFVQIPSLRDALNRNAAELERERQARAEPTKTPVPAEAPEGNVALVMLTASRATDKPAIAMLAPAARRLILWIEIGPSRYRRFRLDILTPDNQTVSSLDRLERNSYGALVASLPAGELTAGDLRIRLSGQEPPPEALVGDYQLRIEKR